MSNPFDTETTLEAPRVFEPDQLYTEKELAERVKMSRHTFRNMRCRGDGPKFVKIGSRARYWGHDLNAYFAA